MHIYHKIYIGIYDLIIALILFYYDALCSVIWNMLLREFIYIYNLSLSLSLSLALSLLITLQIFHYQIYFPQIIHICQIPVTI